MEVRSMFNVPGQARRPFPRPSRRDVIQVATILGVVAVILVSAQSAWAGRDQVAYNQTNLSRQEIFRLHVRANSDAPADQAQKLKVRDAILEVFGSAFAALPDAAAAEDYARRHLAEITAVAERAAARNGPAYAVRATVGTSLFPTRVYGSMVVPSGWYHALQLSIGRGEGRNWWCVLFPPLCLTDLAAAGQDGAPPPTLTAGEIAVLAGADQDAEVIPVELRWKVLEWARAAGMSLRAFLSHLVTVVEAAAGERDGEGPNGPGDR